jgi:hypothetical protein
MRINIKLNADEEEAIGLAMQIAVDRGFPITETQALRAFIREGIERYKEGGKLGAKAMLGSDAPSSGP